MATRTTRNDGPATFRAHREALGRRLPEGLILLASAPEVLRNRDVHFHYRQRSDFLYLTGVHRPRYALLLDPARGREAPFLRRLTHQQAVWMRHIPSRDAA